MSLIDDRQMRLSSEPYWGGVLYVAKSLILTLPPSVVPPAPQLHTILASMGDIEVATDSATYDQLYRMA